MCVRERETARKKERKKERERERERKTLNQIFLFVKNAEERMTGVELEMRKKSFNGNLVKLSKFCMFCRGIKNTE